MTEKHGVYLASKAKHGDRWKALRAADLPVRSTWIDEWELGDTHDYADLWRRNITEASTSKVLIAYREPGETMKGALSEIGAAISHGVPVLWVGAEDGYTVSRHKLVTLCLSLEHALDLARAILAGHMYVKGASTEHETAR
jgi:hypothetical protein